MSERPRDRRLRAELEKMKLLTEEHSSFISFEARGEDATHPEEYIVTFRCRGLSAQPPPPNFLPANWRDNRQWMSNEHVIYINLPATWPKTPPQVRFKTPLFHPNIRQFPTNPQLLMEQLAKDFGGDLIPMVEQAGGFDAMLAMILSNPEVAQRIFSSHVCIDVLFPPERAGSYRAGITLYDLCVEIGKMIMLQSYNLGHGLNDKAIAWTAESVKHRNVLPLDNRSVLDRLAVVHRVEEVPPGEVEIEVESEADEG